MRTGFNILGACICVSSVLSFIDPGTWFFHLPIVFALGCIVYGLGEILHSLEKKKLDK